MLGLVLIAGCAPQTVEVTSSPAIDVPTGYAYKVPGVWTVAVDDAALSQDVPLTAKVCTGASYPVDLRATFENQSPTPSVRWSRTSAWPVPTRWRR